MVNASTSAQITVKECNANGASCTTTEATMTCATTNTTESGGIDDNAVDAATGSGSTWATVSGTPGHVTVCVAFSF